MRRRLLTLALAASMAAGAQAREPEGVKAIPDKDIARLNASFAEPSEDFDVPARVLKAYVPIYPISRLLSGKTGSCKVEITIGANGRAEDLKPDPAADEKMCAHALYALRYWEFSPATRNGSYVQRRFRMPFDYDIQ